MKTISPQKVLNSIGETLLSNLEEWERSNDIFLWLRNIVTEKKELTEFSNHCFLDLDQGNEPEMSEGL